ncbi:MAG TPA: hydroxyacid dehydrogenase [Casimicrobiaceae bacterium]|nr:hydroxyacid dehydrogenase [Casimicrobiaceae bacterium]
MRIVICEFMDSDAVAQLTARFDVRYDKALVDRPDDLARELADADALIVRNRTSVDATLIACAPRLRVVGRLGVGLDNIDVDACAARGIEIIPATGANALAVAEYVIATAMLLLRGAYQTTSDVAAGNWPRAALSNGREMAGKTIGIIGFGGIGRLTGRLARSLGMQAIGFDPQVPPASPIWTDDQTLPRALADVISQADVVSLHVPLVPATRNLIDAADIATMKAEAILINTSRGGVVDEIAVAAALRARKLGGAALDVFEREPLPAGSPLAGCPNLVLTPHIAGLTRESNRRVSELVAAKVAAALAPAR